MYNLAVPACTPCYWMYTMIQLPVQICCYWMYTMLLNEHTRAGTGYTTILLLDVHLRPGTGSTTTLYVKYKISRSECTKLNRRKQKIHNVPKICLYHNVRLQKICSKKFTTATEQSMHVTPEHIADILPQRHEYIFSIPNCLTESDIL